MIKILKLQIFLALLMALGITTFSCLPSKPRPPREHPIKKHRQDRRDAPRPPDKLTA